MEKSMLVCCKLCVILLCSFLSCFLCMHVLPPAFRSKVLSAPPSYWAPCFEKNPSLQDAPFVCDDKLHIAAPKGVLAEHILLHLLFALAKRDFVKMCDRGISGRRLVHKSLAHLACTAPAPLPEQVHSSIGLPHLPQNFPMRTPPPIFAVEEYEHDAQLRQIAASCGAQVWYWQKRTDIQPHTTLFNIIA